MQTVTLIKETITQGAYMGETGTGYRFADPTQPAEKQLISISWATRGHQQGYQEIVTGTIPDICHLTLSTGDEWLLYLDGDPYGKDAQDAIDVGLLTVNEGKPIHA